MKKNRTTVAGITLVLLLAGCAAQPAAEPLVSHGPVASPTPTVTPAATPTVAPEPVAAPAEPVLTVTTTGAVAWTLEWEPPTMSGVYRVVDEAHGFPQDGGARYFISHARSPWSDGRSEGNDWVDALHTPGDIVLLDGERYAIDGVVTAANTDIGSVPIWEHAEGRAVLITCVPRWEGSAVENRIIILERES